MAGTAPQPLKCEPPGWAEYDKRATVADATPMFAGAAVVNRFYARYRFARAFRGLHLEGYSLATCAGYDALTKVSLHWSAFEQFQRAIKSNDARPIAAGYNFQACLATLREVDPQQVFFRFVCDHLAQGAPRQAVTSFVEGKYCSAFALVKAVRHIFLHGPLTPNVQGVSPHTVSKICDVLSDTLVEVMDREFSRNVDCLVKAYP